jgi:heterotetrameric sarcosine oxidase delta subunit
MLLIECPNCGPRNASEYRYGGEVHKRPDPDSASQAEWTGYVYLRDNPLGVVREWWYHRAGCGLWFIAERHTKTHVVERTSIWTPDSQG